MTDEFPVLPEPICAGRRWVFGPRESVVRFVRGEQPISNDVSELGFWPVSGSLEFRMPELWADQVHDYVWAGEDDS